MIPEADDTPQEELVAWLEAYDESLARGHVASTLAGQPPALEPEERDKLQFCLSLLHLAYRSPAPPYADDGRHQLHESRFGRFVIRRELGRGGFGLVFLADDPALRRLVALSCRAPKRLALPALHERFLREARVAARLDHPNIVSIYEAGKVGVVCYIASAYCPGPNMAQWLRSPLCDRSPRTAALLLATIAEAVEYAHSRGILHRDLKPSNILVEPRMTSEAPDGLPFVPKLTDFGLAKMIHADSTGHSTGLVLGTFEYMAPEQLSGDGEAVDFRTDVYCLGVIMYELLTGSTPWSGTAVFTLLADIRNREPPPPRSLRADLPSELDVIVMKCLHKDPRERYAGAGEIAQDLRRFLRGDPIQARPDSLLRRCWRWCRRPERVRDAGLTGIVSTAIAIGSTTTGTLLFIGGYVPFHDHMRACAYFAGLLSYEAICVWAIWGTFRWNRLALWTGTILPATNSTIQILVGMGLIDVGETFPASGDLSMHFAALSLVVCCCLSWSVASLLGLLAFYTGNPAVVR